MTIIPWSFCALGKGKEWFFAMAIESKYKMSRARLEELKAELVYLQTVREREVSELIKEARSFGDLSENSEYDEAKTEQGKLYSKIAEILNLIENAEIIEKVESAGTIVLGSKVKVRDIDSGGVEEYRIVGSQEADPMQGRISDDSPFGRGLLGHKSGETVTVEAPMGQLHFEGSRREGFAPSRKTADSSPPCREEKWMDNNPSCGGIFHYNLSASAHGG